MSSAKLHQLLVEKDLTLSVAESCTGGLLSHLITQNAGASKYFLGGVIAYSNQLKKDLLGVSSKTLDTHGAVSQETAEAMCEGLYQKTKADICLAITGVAGPTGGTPEKPVGLVWMAIRCKNLKIFSMHFDGDRQEIIGRSAEAILDRTISLL